MRFLGCLSCKISVVAVMSAIMAGCMVGPDFHSPKPPDIEHYSERSLPLKTVSTPRAGKSGVSQEYVIGKNISAEWWRFFHSHALNQLIDRAICHSPNLEAAYAALRQAQENLNVQIANSIYPSFNAQLGGERQRFAGATLGSDLPNQIFNLFTATLNIAYNFDVFGGLRRQIEAYAAQVDYQQFQLIATYLTMTSNIVNAVVTIASVQDQIEATHQLIRSQQDQLNILRGQLRLGGISAETVLTQQTLVSQTRATLPPLEKSLAQNKHALSVLIGAYPEEPLPTIPLRSLTLPRHVPISIPSNLVRQRPDVQAAEALMHVASAQVGVATANLLPQFAITGTNGWQAPRPAALFGTSTRAWSIGLMITQPIFQGGALFAARRAAIANYETVFAQYKQTVLQGLQNVADALRAIETDARTLYEQEAAETAARNNLNLVTQQFRLGGSSYLSLLNAQQQYQQTFIARIQAQAARYTDTVGLFQALGGGWWNKCWCVREPTPVYQSRKKVSA